MCSYWSSCRALHITYRASDLTRYTQTILSALTHLQHLTRVCVVHRLDVVCDVGSKAPVSYHERVYRSDGGASFFICQFQHACLCSRGCCLSHSGNRWNLSLLAGAFLSLTTHQLHSHFTCSGSKWRCGSRDSRGSVVAGARARLSPRTA